MACKKRVAWHLSFLRPSWAACAGLAEGSWFVCLSEIKAAFLGLVFLHFFFAM